MNSSPFLSGTAPDFVFSCLLVLGLMLIFSAIRED